MDPSLQTGGMALLGTALVLGLRHGIDWDHIAAITDIAGTTRNGAARGSTLGVVLAAPPSFSSGVVSWQAVWLASLYALGHGAIVIVLGLAALLFGAILPDWIDPLMERMVGATLIFLGVWVVYSLVRYWRGETDFRLQSRWMLVFSGVRRAWATLEARVHGVGGHSHVSGARHLHRIDQYGPATAFGTGLIHGIGAETGTQVLIIAAVGGAATQGMGVGMLFAFVTGLLLSNTAVALLTATGFMSATRGKALYVAAGLLAAVFSLWVGSYALLGISDQLPDIQQPIIALFGEAAA
jgi:high-affinity nickel-transport protein